MTAVDVGLIIGILFPLSIALTAFAYGLIADRADILYVFQRPRLLILSLLAMFVVMPVVALALDLYFDFPHPARIALVVLALTPISAGLATTEIASGGRASYAYGLSFAIATLGVLIVPAMVAFLGDVMGRPFEAPIGTLAPQLLGYIVAPLAVGLVARRLLPRFVLRIRTAVRKIANLALWIALLITLVLLFPSVLQVATLPTLAAMVIFIAAGLAVGHLMGGPDSGHAIVLAIACASRNPGLAIAIAAANFPAQDFVATMVLYGLLVGIVTKPYVRWQAKRREAAASVDGATATAVPGTEPTDPEPAKEQDT